MLSIKRNSKANLFGIMKQFFEDVVFFLAMSCCISYLVDFVKILVI